MLYVIQNTYSNPGRIYTTNNPIEAEFYHWLGRYFEIYRVFFDSLEEGGGILIPFSEHRTP